MALINIDTIRLYIPLSQNTPEDIIDRMITESQEFDLRPFLGDALYFDVINGNQDPFMDGGTYDVDGEPREYAGLNKLLSYYSYARYMRESALRTTSIGIVEKNTTEATKVGEKDRYEENRRRQQLQTTITLIEKYTHDYALVKEIVIQGPEYRRGSIRISNTVRPPSNDSLCLSSLKDCE